MKLLSLNPEKGRVSWIGSLASMAKVLKAAAFLWNNCCVCVATDRNTHITAKCVNTARPTSEDILLAIGDKIGTDSILLCDGNAAYNKLATEKHCTRIELIGHMSYSKVYHLNTINGLHSKFKDMLRIYRGVASKYLKEAE